jgi:hypothetical protein
MKDEVNLNDQEPDFLDRGYSLYCRLLRGLRSKKDNLQRAVINVDGEKARLRSYVIGI